MNFNFGSTGNNSSGGSNNSNPFGTKPGTSGSIFGGGGDASQSGTSTPPVSFGANTPQPAGSLFGGGSTTTTPASGAPTLFGATKPTIGPGQTFPFGTTSSSDAAQTPAAPANTGASFLGGGAAGGNKGALFGGATSTTPGPASTFSLGSTTPAGAPTGPSLFSKPAAASGAQEDQSRTTTAAAAKSLFTTAGAAPTSTPSNLFGAASTGASSASPFGFGQTPAKDASIEKDKPAQAPAVSSLFGGAQAQPASKQGNQATQGTSLFGGGSTTPAATNKDKPAFSFPQTTAPTSTQSDTSKAAASTAAPSTSPFGGQAPASSGTSQAPQSSNLFSNLNKMSTAAPPATSAPAGATTGANAAPTTKPTSTPFSFPSSGGAATGSAPSSTPATTATASTAPAASATATTGATTTAAGTGATTTAATAGGSGLGASTLGASTLGASTTGPAPAPQSNLKNKSMDEIITRWAADLAKYQKQFQQEAEQIAEWDKALVANSNTITDLFKRAFYAERDAGEVERQLRIVEEQQDELGSFLDRYEKEVDGLIERNGMKTTDGLRGPDQERERTYQLAEKLQQRLNELNQDLKDMIGEINEVSQTLSKTGKPDDPLTKVVRVLNSHLAQLQTIDTGANQLQEKIRSAQKESHRLGQNGWQGLGSDPTEDFYRSFRGGRTERFGGVS